MSANDLLARFAPRADPATKPVPSAGTEEGTDYDEAPGDAYRCMRGGHKSVGLRFVFREGGDVTMPYGYLPTTWKGPENSIFIEYPQFTVHLRGRKLDELRARIDEQRVILVREIEELHARSLAIVVTRIEIVGWFPSKQVISLGRVTGLWPQPAPAESRSEVLHVVGRDNRSTITGKGGTHGTEAIR